MTGYQEVLTDPSYYGQIVVFTAPQIGNYGIHDGESESSRPHAVAAVVRAVCERPTHPGRSDSLPGWLGRRGRFGLTGVDTRALTLHIREHGNLRGWLTTEVGDPEAAVEAARRLPKMIDVPAVRSVTAREPYTYAPGAIGATNTARTTNPATTGDPARTNPATTGDPARTNPATTADPARTNPTATPSPARSSAAEAPVPVQAGIEAPRVAVIDFGVKENILRELSARGCRVEVLPATTSLEDLAARRPDGVVLSNGPGDPEALEDRVPFVRGVLERYPTLAICLGHQLVGMALGCRITKLPFGHHGANHPVKDLTCDRVTITSQNHNYAIDAATLPPGLEVTHVNLNDGTIQGIRSRAARLLSVQFHPEASPGPHEAGGLFDRFVDSLTSTPQPTE